MVMQHASSGGGHAVEDTLRAAIIELLGDEAAPLDDDDNLFEFGLDSIRLMRLADTLQRAGLEVGFGELAEEPRVGAWLDLLRTRPVKPAEPAAAPAVDPALPFPLTPVQQSYWIGRDDDQPLGGVGCHAYLELDGPAADPARLEDAVRALIRRHGMLRARFLPDGTQQISETSPWPGLTVYDLRDADEARVAEATGAVREELAHRRLEVERGEVFDVRLTLLPGGAGRLHVDVDLLVCDVLSMRLLLTDLAELYDRPGEAEPLEYSFPAYLADRTARLEKDRETARTYWLDRLPALPGAPALPLAHDPKTVTAPRFTRRRHVLSPELWRRLTARASAHGLTPASVLATAFCEVLSRWSGQERFLLNIPLFDRRGPHPETGALVADFTSLVLLDVDLGGPGGFADRAGRLQSRLHEDLQYTAFSGVEVQRELIRADGDAEPRTAPVVFAFSADGDLASARCRERFGEVGWMLSQTPQVWLDHQIHLTGEGVLLAWDAVEDLFAEGVLSAMFDAYLQLIGDLPESGWDAPPRLPLPAAQRAARARVNATAWPHRPRALHTAFFERAAADPGRPALLWGADGRLTYGELADGALRVAAALGGRGVRGGDLVAVTLPKGPGQIIAVLGVLAAGAAYVPIGVDQPPERRRRMLTTAGAVQVLGESGDEDGPPVLGLGAALDAAPLPAPSPADPSATAYVIFTSGSTGTPKGVELSHAAAANTVDDVNDRLAVSPGDRVLGLSALDFDLSVWDVFGMLSAGAAVVLVAEEDRREPRVWLDLCARHGVTLWNSVPALLDMALTAAGEEPLPAGLRRALLSGDWIGLDLPPRLARATAGRCSLLALGGATEGAIWSNAFDVPEDGVPAGWPSVPYGLPLRGQRYRVVDGAGRDCPDWVPGELWIGGEGVARGYVGDAAHTAERFAEDAGTRWYRTGDLGRYHPGGLLEFLGRLDQQVKINGYRVELGEVEAVLRAHPAVEAAVAVRAETGHLAALLIPAPPAGPQDLDPEELRAWTAARLPGHMVPPSFAVAAALPFNANGKVDRKAVRALFDGRDRPARAFEPIGPGLEQVVAEAWGGVLGRAPAGRDDGFFAAGGDSLLATRVIAALRERTGVELPMREFFREPTARGLAAALTTRLGPDGDTDDLDTGAL
ncbi:amino acid adenylation domain-containing protein [Sphaerisporangium dianthi]|uniref:Phenyloxazoline synthase MbtB n=1 Tax=Sphaerisporangium dianthi TaxID=1436120 RepID=A0ABV9CUU0_9ACTN